ncbi:MAG: hypothetical protein HC860_08405 [Alkalinema sp. RU_4_3]|nr:hypothetical protein [Alkalinema sp. RU_4_3]
MRPLLQRRPTTASPKTRYFLARFRALKQPKVWAAGLGLVGLVVFAHEFSQRPDWQQAFRPADRPTLNQPSAEDLAIAPTSTVCPCSSPQQNPNPRAPSPAKVCPRRKTTAFP